MKSIKNQFNGGAKDVLWKGRTANIATLGDKMKTSLFAKYMVDFMHDYPKARKVQIRNFVNEHTWALTGVLTSLQRYHLFEDIVRRLWELGLLEKLLGDSDKERCFAALNITAKKIRGMRDTYFAILGAFENFDKKDKTDKAIVDRLKLILKMIAKK